MDRACGARNHTGRPSPPPLSFSSTSSSARIAAVDANIIFKLRAGRKMPTPGRNVEWLSASVRWDHLTAHGGQRWGNTLRIVTRAGLALQGAIAAPSFLV
jgi:hypothetical protein